MIVRGDAPFGVQLAQTIHAAGRSAQLAGAARASPPTTALALAVPSEAALAALARALADADVPHVCVYEPDAPWCGALMAIGVVPSSRARLRRLLAHVPLACRKDC